MSACYPGSLCILLTAIKTVGSEAIIDVTVKDTPVFLQTTMPSNGTLAGSIVLNNVQLYNVPIAVGVEGGKVVLEGSTNSMYIESWAQGNVYVGNDGLPGYTQGYIEPPQKPWNILDSQGNNIFGRGHPQYPDYSLDQIVSVKSYGAVGDGYTDDTAALQNIFNMVSFEGYHHYAMLNMLGSLPVASSSSLMPERTILRIPFTFLPVRKLRERPGRSSLAVALGSRTRITPE